MCYATCYLYYPTYCHRENRYDAYLPLKVDDFRYLRLKQDMNVLPCALLLNDLVMHLHSFSI